MQTQENTNYTHLLILSGLFAFIPAIVTTSTFFPFIVGKNVFFRVITCLIALATAYIIFKKKEVKVNIFLGIFFAFTLSFLISAFFGIDTTRSIFSNFERMEGWITYASLFLLLFSLMQITFSKYQLRILLLGMSTVSAACVLFALSELSQTTRISGTYGNAAYLALHSLMFMFISISIIVDEMRQKFELKTLFSPSVAVSWILLFIHTVGVYFSGTRSAILGFGAGMIVALIMYMFHKDANSRFKKVATTCIVAGVVIIGAFVVFRNSDIVQNNPTLARLASISSSEQTSRSRIMTWSMGVEAFKKHPVLGYGQDNFIYIFSEFYNPEMFDQEPWFDRSHNVFVDMLSSGGIIGFLLYCTIFASLTWVLWRKSTHSIEEKTILTGFIVAYLVNNFFVFDNITSWITLMYIAVYIHYGAKEQKINKNSIIYIGVGLILVSAILLLSQSVSTWYHAKGILDGLKTQSTQVILNTLNMSSTGNMETVEQLVTSIPVLLQNNTIPKEDKQKILQEVSNVLQEYEKHYQKYARLWMFIAQFHVNTGSLDGAIRAYENALHLSPNRQIFLGMLSDLYTAHGNRTKSLEYAQKLFEVSKRNKAAGARYAAGLIEQDKQEEAEKLLIDHYATTTIPSRFLGKAYSDKGQFQKALSIAQVLVSTNPQDIMSYIFLAETHARSGNVVEAKKIIDRLKKDYPQYLPQLEVFDKQLH